MKKPNEKLSLEICRDYIKKELFEPVFHTEISPNDPGLIGIELEVFPVRFSESDITKAFPVPLLGKPFSLFEELVNSSANFGGILKSGEKNIISDIEFPNGNSFQFEPGGQVEIATAPCNSLPELTFKLQFCQDILDSISEKTGVSFAQIGTNPWFDTDQIGLQLDKPRYRALQKYFSGIGPFGIQMMRQTCSIHVNLDLGNAQETRVKRMVAANLLVPFATAIFANSGIIQGKVMERKSHRSYLWQNLDASRSGILGLGKSSRFPNLENLIDSYLDFAIKAPIIHVKSLGDRVFPESFTWKYWMQNPIEEISPTLDDFENHLSLLYPEVRPKGFLEIRTADALPKEWQLVPAFFYAGLLYSDDSLNKTIELLFPLANDIERLYREASFGFESERVLRISNQLMNIALESLSALPKEFVGEKAAGNLNAFFEKFTIQGKTVADETISRFSDGNSLIY
ncbi:MAG TPA: glutamate-cysteine ligase family protein [Algoriphagus sp.]|nr:glutamate-cysteine ligase family protein [Algoriphagus sp.]